MAAVIHHSHHSLEEVTLKSKNMLKAALVVGALATGGAAAGIAGAAAATSSSTPSTTTTPTAPLAIDDAGAAVQSARAAVGGAGTTIGRAGREIGPSLPAHGLPVGICAARVGLGIRERQLRLGIGERELGLQLPRAAPGRARPRLTVAQRHMGRGASTGGLRGLATGVPFCVCDHFPSPRNFPAFGRFDLCGFAINTALTE